MAPAVIVAQNGEAPTTPRLNTAPSKTVVHASKGRCCPKERRPEARIHAQGNHEYSQGPKAHLQWIEHAVGTEENFNNTAVSSPKCNRLESVS